MTVYQLCKAIYEVSKHLGNDDRDAIIRVYNKTWNLVVLTHDKLAKPTEEARNRLEDLWKVMDGTRERRMLEQTKANAS
jgi:hypothetical protein